MKKILLTILVLLLVEVLVWLAFVGSGAYNVSTSNHDNGFINWWFDRGTTRSIKQHAASIKVPALDNPAMIEEGFQHFHQMCVLCHGAPGKPPEEIAKGLWPKAPDLSKAVSHWTAAELFWITKNGIKFTAMPGWGPTHNDEKIWALTAFLEQLPKLSASDYQKMEANTVGVQTTGTEHTPENSAH